MAGKAEPLAVLLHMFLHEPEERPGRLLIHGVDALLPIHLVFHELAELQALQMMRESGLLHPSFLHQFRDRHLLTHKEKHHLYSLRIAESLEELLMGGR